jgi:hypothetical protein
MLSFTSRLLTATVAAAALLVPVCARAQSEAPSGPAPSYASPSYGSNEDVVRGQVVSFDGNYSLRVRDEHGYIDNVELHQGTIINPTGLKLVAGMSITVRGVNRGNVLDANQIDTPYNSYASAPAYPVAVVPTYGYAYPVAPYAVYPYAVYPGYGYFGGYGYGYRPSISIGIGFGRSYGYGYRGGYPGRGWHR